MMMQDELIARIWMIQCSTDMKLILLGLAISHHPAFEINTALFNYLAYKTNIKLKRIEYVFDQLDDVGAFSPTEPKGHVVLNLEPDVIARLSS